MTDLSPEQVETLTNRLSGGWDDADARDAAAFLAPTVVAMLAQSWDEGFTARSNEGMRQRSDPDYPIHRTNPYLPGR